MTSEVKFKLEILMLATCIFCQIVQKSVPTDMVCETGSLLVFKDIKPKAPVHLLIVPKKHVESVTALTEEDRELVSDMVFTAKEVAKAQGLGGYRLVVNVGREGGQIVDHLHLHLLGGWPKTQ